MSSSLQNVCRTCMLNESKQKETFTKSKAKMKTRKMISIFTVPDSSQVALSLMELLKTTVPQLKIEDNDELPKVVCLECSKKIKDLYQFQQSCLNNEKQFYKMLQHNEEPNDPFDDKTDDMDIFKVEFDDSFIEENSLPSDDELLVEDDIKIEDTLKEDSIKSCSDLSVDFDWDDKSDIDWENEEKPSNSKITNMSNTHKSELTYDEDDDDALKPTSAKRSAKAKPIGTQQIYPCNKCKRKLKSELSFKKHQEMHCEKDKEERKYECNICTKVFGKSSHLKDHARTHIGEKSFLCSECGKGFTSSSTLKQHSFRHLNRNQFPCPDCPRSFATKPDLISHSSVHKTVQKKNVCDICGRGFKKPFLLKQHKMYHNNERPYKCEFCEKSFVTNEKVKRHTRIHTGEKPFKCKYCEKAYCQSSELVKHLRCHLGDNVYQCELCPLRFPSVKILREHFSTHKKDDEETRTRNLAELNALEITGMFFK